MDRNSGSHFLSGNNRSKHISSERTLGPEARRAMLREEQEMNDKTRIGFLNQCKMELSAEVIRWKEENLKLRKENEAAVKKIEELQSVNNKLMRKSLELESNLFLSWEENKRLKMRTLAIGEENSVLHEKLSKSKFNTYPCFELRKQNSAHSNRLDIVGNRRNASSSSPPAECWEEVSKKLFQQMQDEMREVQKLSLAFCEGKNNDNLISEQVSTSNIVSLNGETSLKGMEKAGNRISHLISQSEMMKKHLKLQNEKLQFLLNNSSGSSSKHAIQPSSDEGAFHKDDGNNATAGCAPDNNQLDEKFKRPSDETFRAYFTQQLTNNNNNNNSKNSKEMHKIMRTLLKSTKSEAKNSDLDDNGPKRIVTSGAAATSSGKITVIENSPRKKLSNIRDSDKKVCPICQYIFSKSFPYSEFEAHVIAHLEDVSASLIDQYEIASQI